MATVPRHDADRARAFENRVRRALTGAGFVPPARGEVYVLLCDSTVWKDHSTSAEQLLHRHEAARAARFHFAHDRATYVLAHALWRVTLALTLGTTTTFASVQTTPEGKPELPGTGFATSLSHSGPWIAIAVGAGSTLGVDIECSPTRVRLTELMSSICCPTESIAFEHLSGSVLEEQLLSLWTRKEALLKAFGSGLGADPASFSALNDSLVLPPASAPTQVPCRVYDLALPADLTGALAAPATVSAIRVIRLA